MSKREICRLVVQLMGIYLFINHVGAFMSYAGTMSMMFTRFSGNEEWWGVAGSIMMMAGGLVAPVFGVLLIVFSGKIASLLTRGDDVYSAENVMPVTKSDVMGTVVACLGLYVAVSALCRMMYLFPNIILYTSMEKNRTYQISSLIGQVAKLCLGLWLFVGYRGFVRFWDKKGKK